MTRKDIIAEMFKEPHGSMDTETANSSVEAALQGYNSRDPRDLEHFVVGCYIEQLENFVRKMMARIP